MARPFKQYMGKNTFGVVREPQEAGEYTLKKKKVFKCCDYRKSYNTANLNINLVTKLNLDDVPVIQQNGIPSTTPAYFNATTPPYLAYTIDPCGNLFGNTICDTNNYQNYLEFNTQPH
jgi:hypothetical protein